MKSKKLLFVFLLLLVNTINYAQQIGEGFAPTIDNLTVPLKSGVYNAREGVGAIPDESHTWDHLLVIRHNNQAKNYQLQLSSAIPSNDRLFFRKIGSEFLDNNPNQSWHELATRGTNSFVGNQTINGTVSATSFGGSGALLTGVNAVSSTFLSLADGPRNLSDRLPNTFTRSVRYDFVTATTTTSSGNYAGVMTYNNWNGTTAGTGDSSYQMAYVNESGSNGTGIPGLKLRKGIDTTWGNWYSIITNNATTATVNYVPRFSGTNGIINSSIYDNGNVGIGTTDPKNKLSVNGTIWAKEVKVSLTDAADWVFDTNYKLKPLADVEKYIYENKHLPEIPSADEFRQNDMNVSEMSNKLLQKIEELTLYAIEQQKELDRLKTENENYKSLAERLSAIEKELKK